MEGKFEESKRNYNENVLQMAVFYRKIALGKCLAS